MLVLGKSESILYQFWDNPWHTLYETWMKIRWILDEYLMSLGWVFYELCEFWISCWMICEKKGQGQKAQNREEIWKNPQKRSFPINWFHPYLSNRLAVTTFISIVLPQMSTMSWDLIMMEVGTSKRPNLVFKENVFSNLMGDMSMQVPHKWQTGSNAD